MIYAVFSEEEKNDKCFFWGFRKKEAEIFIDEMRNPRVKYYIEEISDDEDFFKGF